MLGWLTKRKERKQRELSMLLDLRVKEEIAAMKLAEKITAEADAKRLEELKQAAILAEKERDELLKNSNEPWVKIESESVDVNGRIAIKLDWNPAFIRYLKVECNFSGDEEYIVQKWIGAIYREIYADSKNDALNILKQPGLEEAVYPTSEVIEKNKSN